MRPAIAFAVSAGAFREIVLPALRRAGMMGLKIVEHPHRIQEQVERALTGEVGTCYASATGACSALARVSSVASSGHRVVSLTGWRSRKGQA